VDDLDNRHMPIALITGAVIAIPILVKQRTAVLLGAGTSSDAADQNHHDRDAGRPGTPT
jgi:hypothetical protein